MVVCAALIVMVVVVVSAATSRASALWVALASVPFAVASVLWFVADRAAQVTKQDGQDPYLFNDVN